jgi:hypothetical protein
MGVPGNYSFRFQMAQRDAAGQWQVIQPRAGSVAVRLRCSMAPG